MSVKGDGRDSVAQPLPHTHVCEFKKKRKDMERKTKAKSKANQTYS